MASLSAKMRDYTRAAHGGVSTFTQDDLQNNDNPAQSTASYPRAGLVSQTPEADQRLKTKMQFVDENGDSPFGMVTASDSDFALVEQKRKLAEDARFDSWVGQNFHQGDVAKRKWLQETMPEFYESREAVIMQRAKFAARVALLKLRGPQNEKDLILLWGLQTGRIKLEPGWNVIGYTDQGDTGELNTRFMEGVFGPMRYRNAGQRQASSEQTDNPFRETDGAGGKGQWSTGGFLGSLPTANGRADFNTLFGNN